MSSDSGGSAGPAPDYVGAAREQSAASREIANQQTFANRPQLNTPWGQMTWGTSASYDPATGQPITQWTGNLNLTPEQQTALDSQQRIQQGRSGAAEQLLGQATGATATPFNWAAMPAAARTPGQTTQTTNEPQFGAERRRIEEGLFNQMRPEHMRQEDATRTRLSNMGLSPGSEAYNRELERLQGTQAGERFNAMQTAGQEQARMQQMLMGQQGQAFGQSMQGANFQSQLRQQAIAEEAQRRGMPLSELNALLTGQQVATPQMPAFNTASSGQAPNLLGAAQSQGQYQLGAQQLANEGGGGPDFGSLIGTVGNIAGKAGLFGSAAQAAFMM